MRVILALVSTLLLPISLMAEAWAAQSPSGTADEAQAIRAFKKAFRKASRKAIDQHTPPDSAARQAAVEALRVFDSERIAKALIKGYVVVRREVDEADAERQEQSEQLAKIINGRNIRTLRLPRAQMAAYQSLRRTVATLRRQIAKQRDTLTRVGQAVSEMRDPAAIRWLLKSVSGSRRYSLYLKTKVAQAASGAGVDALPNMLVALHKTKVPAEAAALLVGIGALGKAAKPAAEVVIAHLSHEASIVRESAALASSTICDPRAIEPMIELLGRSHGQAKNRVAAYLEALTRQAHGTSASTWKRWFAAEGAKFAAGEVELGGGAPSHRKKTAKNYYFGIPQDGKSIVYIIDSSGSMKAKIKLKLPPLPGKGRTIAKMADSDEDEEQDTTRLEACKTELIRALGRLEPTTMFNVIWYSHQPHMFGLGMRKAKPKLIKAAQEWVRKLQPRGSTNIHDSMQMAFQLTGQVPGPGNRGPTTGKRKAEVTPDTVFLLSDGSPTTPDGKLDSTEKIIEAVRDWNSLKAVIIHCIGIGRGVNEPFMHKLATENGGEFKKFL